MSVLMESDSLITKITQLILNWQLREASAFIDTQQNVLSVKDIFAMRNLLDHYLEWDNAFSEIIGKIDSDPAAAQYMLNQIPEEIRITYPQIKSIYSSMELTKDKQQIDAALKKCDEAYESLLHELNEKKAKALIEEAKRIFPNWDRNNELRERINNIQELHEKLARGLQIQTEVSALREKGGQSAYQKAMSLINEYTSLGLENVGIALFDVAAERDHLLQMITRAEGKSWSHRLTITSESEEILRLEQSIHSLEDAESKNLRVLFNNNARLLNLLTKEKSETESDSEKSIQLGIRIEELRKNNQQIETDIRTEVGKRSMEYCTLAQAALKAGELSTAEINIRLAKETGKSADPFDPDEFLGDIDLPTSVLDSIDQLEETLKRVSVVRNEVEEKLRNIREQFSAEENITLNNLSYWISVIEECFEKDPNTPGLSQFRTEINNRYQSVRTYAFEKGIREIDRSIKNGKFTDAKIKLDFLIASFPDDQEKEQLTKRLNKISVLEKIFDQIDGLQKQIAELYHSTTEKLESDAEHTGQLESYYQKIQAIYKKYHLQEPKELEINRFNQLRIFDKIGEYESEIKIVKNSIANGILTAESLSAAEKIEISDLYSVETARDLLARFWFFCAKVDNNRENLPRYLAKAERIAEDCNDSALHQEISAFRITMNEKNEEGKRVNLLLETLNQFWKEKTFLAGIDYISKNVTVEDRKNPQIFQLVDRIEQAYRFNLSEELLKSAKEAFSHGDYQKAEEDISRSLDYLYSVEGAQLQKTINSIQQFEENNLKEIENFLNQDVFEDGEIDVLAAEEIRYIADRIDSMEKSQMVDRRIRSRIGTAKNRIIRIKNQETGTFNNLRQQFENALMLGEEGLEQAESVLKDMDSRIWIENRSSEILSLKMKLDEIKNILKALRIVINQSDHYLHQGDFRSAERILAAFHADAKQKWPDWLLILKENAEFRIRELHEKYQQVQSRFEKKDSNTGEVIDEANRILDPKSTDAVQSFRLTTELGQYKTILERDIRVDSEQNPYMIGINYLLDVLKWNEIAIEAVSGMGNHREGISLDALYGIRKAGRDLFDRMPPALVGIQPSFAERNKWLEERTRVRQLLLELEGTQKKTANRPSERQSIIRRDIQELEKLSLLPNEEESLSRIKKIQENRKKRKGCLFSGILFFILALAGLYLASPILIPYLTPEPTISYTPSMTFTPSLTASPTMTMTATLTATPTLTPTATFTHTPTATPMGLTGVIRNHLIGVYELPDGNTKMLSNGYLEPGSEVEIIRYCESAVIKGEYWALIFYPSQDRNTGWIRIRLPDSLDYVLLSDTGQPSLEVLNDNPALKMTCPLKSYIRMPGDPTITPTVSQQED